MHSAFARCKAYLPQLIVAVAMLFVGAWIGGPRGVGYLFFYALALVPGLPLGFALFGRSTPGWIAGAALGYALSAFALWVPIALRVASIPAFAAAWTLMAGATWVTAWRRRAALVSLPEWTSETTSALCLLLVLTLALVARPYARIGEEDSEGNRRYRAYFTADFVWHEALTAEVARFSSPPRNPYLASRPLQYYWLYFIVPAVATAAAHSHSPPIETFLAVGGIATGMLLISAVFLAAWAAVPSAGVTAVAVALVAFAWSAEGSYALLDLYRHGQPLSGVRELNIDAITSWFFQGLTIDGLPRSIWYNPQHSMSCVLGLVALTAAARAGAVMNARAAAICGTCLGLAVMLSPFPGGALTLIYGFALLLAAARIPARLPKLVLTQMAAVTMVAAALGWCVFNRTFEGAGSAVSIGLSELASSHPHIVMALAIGPLLVPVAFGLLAVARRRFPGETLPAVTGLSVTFMLLFFVTLVLEPIWIGWRAGQVLLVVSPALVAAGIRAWASWSPRFAWTAVTLLFLIGLPTTLIDAYNAQDTSNVEMAAGFRWTVVISKPEQETLAWIERFTPPDALVQMSLNPRGRETWSLIPSFARRRMAAGLPISLLRTPIYEERAAQVDAIFSGGDGERAAAIARELRIDYIYAGPVEREAFGERIGTLDGRPDLFPVVYRNGPCALYAVR